MNTNIKKPIKEEKRDTIKKSTIIKIGENCR